MLRKIRENISGFIAAHRKDKILQYYQQAKYDKVIKMLKTYDKYKQMQFDEFPFIYFMIEQGKVQPIQKMFQNYEYTKKIINDDTNPMDATPIAYSLLQGKNDIIKLLEENGASLNLPNSHSQNALHLAAIYQRTQAFKEGITSHNLDFNLIDEYGNTPFHYAARTGSVQMVTTLIFSKAKKIANKQHQYPVHMAIQSGNIECFDLLKNDIKINFKNFHPLHSAVRSHNEQMLKILVNLCPLYVNVQDYRGLTPLHHAILNDEANMVKFLLDQRQIKLNVQDEHGNTPLHLSLYNNNPEISSLLVRKGAQLDIQNNDMLSPADYGLSSNAPEIRSLMFQFSHKSNKIKQGSQAKF